MSEVLACSSTWSPHAELLCWVLMPDHWHGLMRLTSAATLAHVVGTAKRAIGACGARRTGPKASMGARFP